MQLDFLLIRLFFGLALPEILDLFLHPTNFPFIEPGALFPFELLALSDHLLDLFPLLLRQGVFLLSVEEFRGHKRPLTGFPDKNRALERFVEIVGLLSAILLFTGIVVFEIARLRFRLL